MSNQATFQIVNKADEDYCIAIRGRKLVLALSNPSDPYQQWIRKDSATKDEEGEPTFALVNKASDEAIWHDGRPGPMTLVRYNAGSNDRSVLWSVFRHTDRGFMYIRMASLVIKHMTTFNHVIQDGRVLELNSGDHIMDWWKFVPYSINQQEITETVTISCLRFNGFNLAVHNNTVMLAPADPEDKKQIWIKHISYGKQVKDGDQRRSFALINKATGQAIKHGFGPGYLVELVTFNPRYLDGSLLWTESGSKEHGFLEIRMQTNTSVLFGALYVNTTSDSNKPLLALWARNGCNEQCWKFERSGLSGAIKQLPCPN